MASHFSSGPTPFNPREYYPEAENSAAAGARIANLEAYREIYEQESDDQPEEYELESYRQGREGEREGNTVAQRALYGQGRAGVEGGPATHREGQRPGDRERQSSMDSTDHDVGWLEACFNAMLCRPAGLKELRRQAREVRELHGRRAAIAAEVEQLYATATESFRRIGEARRDYQVFYPGRYQELAQRIDVLSEEVDKLGRFEEDYERWKWTPAAEVPPGEFADRLRTYLNSTDIRGSMDVNVVTIKDEITGRRAAIKTSFDALGNLPEIEPGAAALGHIDQLRVVLRGIEGLRREFLGQIRGEIVELTPQENASLRIMGQREMQVYDDLTQANSGYENDPGEWADLRAKYQRVAERIGKWFPNDAS